MEGVLEHLASVSELPRWGLQLDDNPRVKVDRSPPHGVIVTDTLGGRDFSAPMVGTSHLYIHAEEDDPPMIGNWKRVSFEPGL